MRGAPLVVAAASLWGTTGTARELGPDAASPLSVGATRLSVGGAVLLAALLLRTRGQNRRRGDGSSRGFVAGGWRPGPLLLAVACMAAYQPLFFGGVSRAGVAVGTVVGIGSSPIVGGLLGRFVRGEHLGVRWLACTAVAVAGAVLLATVGAGDSGEDAAVGLLLACGAGTVYAIYVAASAVLLDDHDAADVAAVVLGGAGLVLVPVALASHPGWVLSARGGAVALWLGLVTVAVAYPLLARGLADVGVGVTSTLTLAEPAVAATLGLVVLGERLPAAGFAGLGLVAAGVVVEAVLSAQQGRSGPGEGGAGYLRR